MKQADAEVMFNLSKTITQNSVYFQWFYGNSGTYAVKYCEPFTLFLLQAMQKQLTNDAVLLVLPGNLHNCF